MAWQFGNLFCEINLAKDVCKVVASFICERPYQQGFFTAV